MPSLERMSDVNERDGGLFTNCVTDHFHEPTAINFNRVSHIFLLGKHKLVVDYPPGGLFKKGAGGVDEHSLGMFD